METLKVACVRRMALVVTCCAAAAPAAGQAITSPYEFVENGQFMGPTVGYVVTSRGLLNLGPRSGTAYGFGYSVRLGGPFNLDAAAMLLPTTRTVMDTIPGDSATLTDDPLAGVRPIGEHDLGIGLLTAALRFDITGPRTFHRFQPYGIFGGGFAFRLWEDGIADVHLISARRFEFTRGFAGQIGGGAELFLSDRFVLRLDLRDTFWKLRIPTAFQRLNVPEDEWVQNLHASLGIGLRF